MARWFLSYHSPDQILAERLKAAIEHKNAGARVFFAPAHLRAGGFWCRALADEIAQADAFILLVGTAGVGPWQLLEYDEALERRVKSSFPLVLVLMEGQTAPGLPFLRRLHWIVAPDPASDRDVGRLVAALAGDGATPSELWRFTSPYRGLAAMEEKDSDYFFGRESETADVLAALAEGPDRLPVIIGNSGVGKSSVAQAGVVAALKREVWPLEKQWPPMLHASRQWCYLRLRPGDEPLKALVQAFLDIWQYAATDPARARDEIGWVDLLRDGKGTLRDLLDATQRRYQELDLPVPDTIFLYVDQGEELYARGERKQRERFSEVLAQALGDRRFRAMMTIRSDFLGDLQGDEPLFKARRQIDLPPLRETELHRVINRPADTLAAKFESDQLAAAIASQAAEESAKDAGALPLLSYLLDDMWTKMVAKGDGILRLPAQAIDLGRVLVTRADAFLASHPASEEALRHILTLKLATVHQGEEPTRRAAARSEFSDEEWRLISDLADHPYRLLVTATSAAGETYAEVAHEAIFRRWTKLKEWIAAEREFLAWRSNLESARKAWEQTPSLAKRDALLMGVALAKAESWFTLRREDLATSDRDFIAQSLAWRRKVRRRTLQAQMALYALMASVIIVLVAWINQSILKDEANWFLVMRPYKQKEFTPHILSAEAESALKPGQTFRECAASCPDMVVLRAGDFTMGSPGDEPGRDVSESPQHRVTIARPFAVSKFAVRFDDWDACVRVGGCDEISDSSWGRGARPAINVSWKQARTYVGWLRRMTGQPYRLLTEAEWEYAARAGTTTAYYWGNEVGQGHANCNGCGSGPYSRTSSRTSPVGQYPPNPFGLYDMLGNAWEWVSDCRSKDYSQAPTDGSAWLGGDCGYRMCRGGAWFNSPADIRAARRGSDLVSSQNYLLGFRIARTLTTAEGPR